MPADAGGDGAAGPRAVVCLARIADVDVSGPDPLTAAERVRLARLARPQDRAAYRAAHVLVRRCAAALLGPAGGPAEGLVVRQECPGCGGTDRGRPVLASHPRVGLALSHSEGHVAAVACHGPCGVDVEDLPGAPVPARALSDAERHWVASAPPGSALRLWVRKEALVKAGAGGLEHASRLEVLHADGPASTAHGFALAEWRDAAAVGAWAVPTAARADLVTPEQLLSPA